MRKLIFAINITLDGCCDHTKFSPDEEILRYHTQLLQDSGLLVFGRKTYQLMVPYWPEAANDNSSSQADRAFAQVFVKTDKLVFSKTLDQSEDKNTKIVSTNPADEILKLKKEAGKNILIGGVSLPSQLIEPDLIDEYHFILFPVIAGEGRRLLDGINLTRRLQLKLVGTRIFESGCVVLHYIKR